MKSQEEWILLLKKIIESIPHSCIEVSYERAGSPSEQVKQIEYACIVLGANFQAGFVISSQLSVQAVY